MGEDRYVASTQCDELKINKCEKKNSTLEKENLRSF